MALIKNYCSGTEWGRARESSAPKHINSKRKRITHSLTQATGAFIPFLLLVYICVMCVWMCERDTHWESEKNVWLNVSLFVMFVCLFACIYMFMSGCAESAVLTWHNEFWICVLTYHSKNKAKVKAIVSNLYATHTQTNRPTRATTMAFTFLFLYRLHLCQFSIFLVV